MRAAIYPAVSRSVKGRSSVRRATRCFSWRSEGACRRSDSSGCPTRSSVAVRSDVAFGVGQQPELLEQLERHALRFVDDQREDAAGAVACVDGCFHLLEKTGLRADRVVAELELPHQELVELGTRQRRIRQDRDPRCVGPLRLQRRANQRRLPHPGFADEQRDPWPPRQPVAQVDQRLVMLRGEKQEPGVRRKVERPLAKAEVLFVHRQFQVSARPPRGRRRR